MSSNRVVYFETEITGPSLDKALARAQKHGFRHATTFDSTVTHFVTLNEFTHVEVNLVTSERFRRMTRAAVEEKPLRERVRAKLLNSDAEPQIPPAHPKLKFLPLSQVVRSHSTSQQSPQSQSQPRATGASAISPSSSAFQNQIGAHSASSSPSSPSPTLPHHQPLAWVNQEISRFSEIAQDIICYYESREMDGLVVEDASHRHACLHIAWPINSSPFPTFEHDVATFSLMQSSSARSPSAAASASSSVPGANSSAFSSVSEFRAPSPLTQAMGPPPTSPFLSHNNPPPTSPSLRSIAQQQMLSPPQLTPPVIPQQQQPKKDDHTFSVPLAVTPRASAYRVGGSVSSPFSMITPTSPSPYSLPNHSPLSSSAATAISAHSSLAALLQHQSKSPHSLPISSIPLHSPSSSSFLYSSNASPASNSHPFHSSRSPIPPPITVPSPLPLPPTPTPVQRASAFVKPIASSSSSSSSSYSTISPPPASVLALPPPIITNIEPSEKLINSILPRPKYLPKYCEVCALKISDYQLHIESKEHCARWEDIDKYAELRLYREVVAKIPTAESLFNRLVPNRAEIQARRRMEQEKKEREEQQEQEDKDEEGEDDAEREMESIQEQYNNTLASTPINNNKAAGPSSSPALPFYSPTGNALYSPPFQSPVFNNSPSPAKQEAQQQQEQSMEKEQSSSSSSTSPTPPPPPLHPFAPIVESQPQAAPESSSVSPSPVKMEPNPVIAEMDLSPQIMTRSKRKELKEDDADDEQQAQEEDEKVEEDMPPKKRRAVEAEPQQENLVPIVIEQQQQPIDSKLFCTPPRVDSAEAPAVHLQQEEKPSAVASPLAKRRARPPRAGGVSSAPSSPISSSIPPSLQSQALSHLHSLSQAAVTSSPSRVHAVVSSPVSTPGRRTTRSQQHVAGEVPETPPPQIPAASSVPPSPASSSVSPRKSSNPVVRVLKQLGQPEAAVDLDDDSTIADRIRRRDEEQYKQREQQIARLKKELGPNAEIHLNEEDDGSIASRLGTRQKRQ